MRKTWAAPDIEFDKDGRRIRPEEPAAPPEPKVVDLMAALEESLAAARMGRCLLCNGSGMVSLGPSVRGIGRCPRCALRHPGVRS